MIPILDGHAGSDRDFISIKHNAESIVEYIDKLYSRSVALIGGLSLGGQILVEMLAQRNDICRYAMIESALVIPMKFTHVLIKPMIDMSYGLIKQKWFSKLQFKSLKMKKELYNDYYRDSCKITKENMIAFLKANSDYTASNRLSSLHEQVTKANDERSFYKSCAKCFIFVGEKESPKMICSAYHLKAMFPNSKLKIMKKWYHGEFFINHPTTYANTVIEILKNS